MIYKTEEMSIIDTTKNLGVKPDAREL